MPSSELISQLATTSVDCDSCFKRYELVNGAVLARDLARRARVSLRLATLEAAPSQPLRRRRREEGARLRDTGTSQCVSSPNAGSMEEVVSMDERDLSCLSALDLGPARDDLQRCADCLAFTNDGDACTARPAANLLRHHLSHFLPRLYARKIKRQRSEEPHR